MKIKSVNTAIIRKKAKVLTIVTSYVGSWTEEPYFDILTLRKVVTVKLAGVIIAKYESKIDENDYPVFTKKSLLYNDKDVILS